MRVGPLVLALLLAGPAAAADESLRAHRPDVSLVTVWRRPAVRDLDAAILRAMRGPMTAERSTRIGELLAARADAARMQRLVAEMHRPSRPGQGAQALHDGEVDRRLRDAERRDRSAAVAYLSRAALDRTAPMPPAVARALALLARTRIDLEQRTEALAAAARLLEGCPGCAQAAEAAVLLGDDRFDRGDLAAAAAFFGDGLRAQGLDPRAAAYLHYKRAWCEIAQGDDEAGLADLLSAERTAFGLRGAGALMRREAARDVARLLPSMRRTPEEVETILRALARGDARLAADLAARSARARDADP